MRFVVVRWKTSRKTPVQFALRFPAAPNACSMAASVHARFVAMWGPRRSLLRLVGKRAKWVPGYATDAAAGVGGHRSVHAACGSWPCVTQLTVSAGSGSRDGRARHSDTTPTRGVCPELHHSAFSLAMWTRSMNRATPSVWGRRSGHSMSTVDGFRSFGTESGGSKGEGEGGHGTKNEDTQQHTSSVPVSVNKELAALCAKSDVAAVSAVATWLQ